MSALLELVDVTRIHREGESEVRALDGVSLRISYGELVAVMGPSGSGKTTLLNLAAALDTPTSGRVLVGGQEISSASAEERAALRRRQVGLVFQEYNLVSSLTALENVALPLELDGTPAREAQAEARGLLERVGLTERADDFPDKLSGGERQRVAIARAVSGARTLLLADEPTGALDSILGEDVIALLRAQIGPRSGGLLVTHDPRYAAWADRTVFLADGRIASQTGVLERVTDLLDPAQEG
ncbi:ABC transporter ATP-binding protein [Microbacterium halotolerans]|uniref:ABC transporter ATP-binding protein n=1 Tax=Microbacterium halotolerans TaxID=246613 RepID=UPI000E6A9648|nr:ABC transporter ATP-binding protein [Microbacterium halotolerans]